MTYPSQVKYVLFGKETSYGSGGTADKDVGLVITDVSTPTTKTIIESQGISSPEVQFLREGIIDPSVNLEGDFQHGRILEYVFGSVAHVETTGDWRHTFTVASDVPSARIEVGNNSATDSVLDFDGMMYESGELSTELNQNLKLSATFKGKGMATSASASTAVLSTLTVFPHATVDVTINGTPATEVQSASIKFENTVERAGGIGSNEYQQSHRTSAKFTYSATLGFSDKTFHDLFVNGTVHEFALEADNGVTLGSGRRDVSITLENCLASSDDEPTSVGGLTFITIEGTGTLKTAYSTDNISSSNW